MVYTKYILILVMYICRILQLPEKNEGICRDSQEQQIYQVTVLRLPLSDIAQAHSSIAAEYMAMNIQ